MKYILGAFLLLGLAAAMNAKNSQIEDLPLAIVLALVAERKCIGNQIFYHGIKVKCDSPLQYFDVRKLDMRADNHNAGRSGSTIKMNAKK